jgi:uncharacterized protein YbjT (DUF2867 family)
MGMSADVRRSAQNVVTAARHAGVYLSGLHPEGADLSTHLTSRTTVGEILIASGIETVVLQAGVVVSSGSASVEMIQSPHRPAAGDDDAQTGAQQDPADCPVPTSRAWDVGGPDVLEYGDMMRIYAEVAGLARRRILVLPVLTPGSPRCGWGW